jgi:hypothetical protein
LDLGSWILDFGSGVRTGFRRPFLAFGVHDGAVGLKPSHACDGISAVAEFMVDVAGFKAPPCVRRHQCSGRVHG